MNDSDSAISKTSCIEATKICACFNLRRTSRAVTQIYDEALRPVDLRSGQFVLLLASRILESATIQQLADTVGLDRSALSRNLKPLLNRGLVRVAPGPDRRTRWISLTDAGENALVEAYPIWEQVQAKITEIIGDRDLMALLDQLSVCLDRIKQSESGQNREQPEPALAE